MFYSFSVEPPKIYYMGSWWVCVVVEKMKLIPAYDVSYGWWQCERAPNLQGGHRSRVLEERDDFGKRLVPEESRAKTVHDRRKEHKLQAPGAAPSPEKVRDWRVPSALGPFLL